MGLTNASARKAWEKGYVKGLGLGLGLGTGASAKSSSPYGNFSRGPGNNHDVKPNVNTFFRPSAGLDWRHDVKEETPSSELKPEASWLLVKQFEKGFDPEDSYGRRASDIAEEREKDKGPPGKIV